MAQKIKTDIEYMTWLTAILNLYGMYTDDINAISTVGFLTHALVDTNDAVIYKANQAIKESHVITAQKLDSLYKHAREVEIEPTFSIPAAMDMVLVISERNFEIEAMGNDQIKYYIINKSNIITVGNFVYSFDYDIEIRLEKGQNGEKYLTARYMTDGVNKNPISNLINPTIRAIREKKDNTYEYHLFVRLQQYSRELYEAEFGNRDFAVFNVGTKRATDEIACIDVFREHSSLNTSSEPIRLEKKMRGAKMKISEAQIQNVIRIYEEKKMKKNPETLANKNGLYNNPSLVLVSVDLKKYHAKYREIPSIRENLVQDLKNKIQCGTYNIHGLDIVEKLMGREAADLLSDISSGD